MATIKGHANCPECGSNQAVMHDTRKYYISCSECRTFTSYQSKAAKERIAKKLVPIEEPTPEPKPEPQEPPQPKIHKPARANTGSVLDALDDLDLF